MAALRGFRPRLLIVLVLGIAVAWQSVPIIKNAVGGYTDQAQAATFWNPALEFLRPIAQRAPNYRVEVVATWGHSEAYYLPKSGIPLAGGWYRQNAYRPQDLPCLSRRAGHGARSIATGCARWACASCCCRRDELDPAARAEAALLRAGVPGARAALVLAAALDLRAARRVADPDPAAGRAGGRRRCGRASCA